MLVASSQKGSEEIAMSNLTAIGMILALLISGTLVMFVATHITHVRGDAVTTGQVRGVPVSIKERWMILFHDWMPAAFGLGALGFVLAFGQVAIAENVSDDTVKLLAWLCAGLAAFTGLFWIILGASYFTNCVLLLREAARN